MAANSSIREEIASKRAVITARKLYDITGQAPSPSKDFCQILVTEKGIIWRRWKITLRNFSQGTAPSPNEVVMNYEDFLNDKSFQKELEFIFSPQCVKQIHKVISGCNDALSCLPEQLITQVIMYLDLQSIMFLSHTNQHFREICNSDDLWKKLYLLHQGQPSADIHSVANDIGWKKLFFMNKLQIQKEVSRLRRGVVSPSSNATIPADHSAAFLTQQIED